MGDKLLNTIPVKLKENSYSIVVGHHILRFLGTHLKKLHLGKDAVVITHPFLRRKYGSVVEQSLKKEGFTLKFIEVPVGEQSKSAQAAFDVIEKIARYDIYKDIFIAALGGGVVGDLAGYAASCYKRGVPYIQIPTTLLAQIDSAIGGKAAVDLPVGKNLVGAIYQPKIVFSDAAVLKTLDQRQIRNGLAEAVKYGIIDDAKLFHFIDQHIEEIFGLNDSVLSRLITSCSRIKAKVVMKDEKETKGIRTILNFGHTLGHAIEAAGKFKLYQHGEAIALGMRIASEISLKLKCVNEADVLSINQLISKAGLPEKIKGLKINDILSMMKHDKKFLDGKNRFVLVQHIGKVVVNTDIPHDVIISAVKSRMS